MLFETGGDVMSDITGKLVISSDILVEIISPLDRVGSIIDPVGSIVNIDIISNDVIVTLVYSCITEDDIMDNRGDDVIITVITSLNKSVLSEENSPVGVIVSISNTEISDDEPSKDVRGARVDNEAIVGLTVNILVSDTEVTVDCSVVAMVGSINDSKVFSVTTSTTLEEWLAIDTTSDDVIKDGVLDNTGVDVNSVMDILVESTDDGIVLNNVVVMDWSVIVSIGCVVSVTIEFVNDDRVANVLLRVCVSPEVIEVENVSMLFEVGGDTMSDITEKLVISSDILVEIISPLDRVGSTIDSVGSIVNIDIISNDVIVTLVYSCITEDDIMDNRGDDVIITVITSLNKSVLSKENSPVGVVISISDTEISDDGLSKDVRGARVDNEAIVGLAVNMLVSDTVVTVNCSVIAMVGSINDSKLSSVIKSTTLEESLAVNTTSDNVIKDGGLDNVGMDVNSVTGIMVESIDDVKVIIIVLLGDSETVKEVKLVSLIVSTILLVATLDDVMMDCVISTVSIVTKNYKDKLVI